MDTPVLESCKKASSVQLTACGVELNSNSDITAHSVKDTRYASRFFYNSAVRPRDIANLLAKKSKNALNGSKIEVKTRIFGRGVNSSVNPDSKEVTDIKPGGQCKLSSPPVVQPQLHSHSPKHGHVNNVQCNVIQKAVEGHGQGLNINDWQHTQASLVTGQGLNPVTVQQFVSSDLTEVKCTNHLSIIHFKQFSKSQISLGADSPIF